MYRILIVDDEPMALYSTAHTFPWADWGFDPPVLMTEAPAALDKLRTERFDAAIVDIRSNRRHHARPPRRANRHSRA